MTFDFAALKRPTNNVPESPYAQEDKMFFLKDFAEDTLVQTTVNVGLERALRTFGLDDIEVPAKAEKGHVRLVFLGERARDYDTNVHEVLMDMYGAAIAGGASIESAERTSSDLKVEGYWKMSSKSPRARQEFWITRFWIGEKEFGRVPTKG